MTHHAKAPSAGSTQATGSSRGLLRRALATRAASSRSKGTSAPSSRRAPITLIAALAITALAITAAPASAAPPTVTTTGVSEVGYTTVHVTGTVTSDGSGTLEKTQWGIQCSTDPTDPTKWVTCYATDFGHSLAGEFTDKPVAENLNGLKPGTKYSVRLIAQNGFSISDPPEAVAPAPYPSFTTLPVDPPTIPGTVEASPVFSTSATATGKVKRPANPANPGPGVDAAFDVNCHFEYITDAQFEDNITNVGPEAGFQGATPVDCTQNPIKDADAGIEKDVDANFAPGTLTPSTTYHLRLVAENASGPVIKDAANFTTAAKVAPPAVTTVNDPSEVKFSSAKLTGKILRPAGADPALNVNCHFEYVTEAAFQPLSEQQKLTLTGATGGTFTLGFAGETTAPIAFDASAAQVQGALESLSSIGAGSVSVSGNYTIDFIGALADKDVEQIYADPSALEEAGVASAETTIVTEGHAGGFESPQTTDCEQNPITEAKVDEDGEIEVSAKAGTVATTKYHFRLIAENEGGTDTADGANTFTTPEAELPTVTIDPVEGGTFTTAHVSGTVEFDDPGHDPLVSEGSHFIEFSTDNVNWIRVGFGGQNDLSNVTHTGFDITHDLTGLQPSTTYFFRIGATYSSGTYDQAIANGEVAFSPLPNPEITTEPAQAAPTAEGLAVTGVTATTAHFSATVNPNAPAGPLSPAAKKAYATNWHFECTPDCRDHFGNEIGGIVQGEQGPQTVTADVEGLDPNTEYEVTLVTHSEGGDGIDAETFPTKLIKPTVKALPGGSDGKGGYVLQGTVNPNNSPISDCTFAWGPEGHEELEEYAFQAACSPMPQGRDEVQSIVIFGDEGQFRLSFRGQSTGDIEVTADAPTVEAELKALSTVAPGEVTVAGQPGKYKVTFEGSLGGSDLPQITGESGSVPLRISGNNLPGSVAVSTSVPGGNSSPVTVEAPLTGLSTTTNYSFRLFATNEAGTEKTENLIFKPTLVKADPCANEQQRTENNSLALPECRAYEMVTPPGKEGFGAQLETYDGGARVAYGSEAGNIARSGQNLAGFLNQYVAARTAAGWQTIPNLNGSSGSFYDAPSYVNWDAASARFKFYSRDLLSSVWSLNKKGNPDGVRFYTYLRNPDGAFAPIGFTQTESYDTGIASSDDLSHLVNWNVGGNSSPWGPGVYEFLGTGTTQPRRVDLDNSGAPISACTVVGGNARNKFVSSDGNTIVNYVYGGCGGANPPADELWARVNGTTAFDVSASHCTRLDCNASANPTFVAANPDGSRVFFTTTQQLVDEDTDQTNDIYACDIPSGNPAPTPDKANPCAAFRQVSGAQTGADVESVNATSENGATVLFTAQGKLADNDDALKEKAVAGDHNLYVWRTDASHPDGQTAFVARLDSNDVNFASGTSVQRPQFTPDGRYLVFTTASQLVDTDTDSVRDVYRYDAETGALTRVSTNIFGVAGNGDFDARAGSPSEHHPTTTVSDDGTKIVFTTTEPLNLAVDGNAEPDVYLWTPARVSLISTGSSGFAPRRQGYPGGILNPAVAIDPAGQDIYFESAQALTPADPDDSTDVYDARIGGGFSFPQPPICTGEPCQPDPSPPTPTSSSPANQPNGDGNVKPPKPCPKGKVRNKKGKCVPKHHKKHSGKKHQGKKASHKQGGGK